MSAQPQRHNAPFLLSLLMPLISGAGILLSSAMLKAAKTMVTEQQHNAVKTYAPATLSSLLLRIAAPQRWHRNMSGIPESLHLDADECHFTVVPGSYTLHENYVSLQQTTLDGVHYAVFAHHNGQRELHIEVPLKVTDNGLYAIAGLPDDNRNILGTGQVPRFEFLRTCDNTLTSLTGSIDPVNAMLHFSMPVDEYEIGKIDGTLRLSARQHVLHRFIGYAYAIPDRQELNAFLSMIKN